jgi:hypothetical protein
LIAMLEKYAFYVLALGALLGVVGYVWLLVVAFRQRALWGIALLLFPPSAVIFIVRHTRRATVPLCLLVLAGVIFAIPYGASYYERHFVPLKPYEQIVDGELRITLTGLKDFDYAALRERSDVVVLQMANEDVDDRTLENLKGMNHLRKLDISGAKVTDEGLRILAELPALAELYLARTKITDDGFKKYLGPKESLLKVDLTGTEVKGKTKRDWKKARQGEREYVD